MTISHRVGLLLFPKITQLDLAGPYEVFCRMPGAAVHLLWKDTQPIKSEWGLELRPDTRFDDCPALDVFCVPGGPGAFELFGDDADNDRQAITLRHLGVHRGIPARCRWPARWQARNHPLGVARSSAWARGDP